MNEDLHKLQARTIALSRAMNDLKERRDRGRIDEGRYVDLMTDIDRERIEILLGIQKTLQGKDEDIDDIVRGAINGTEELILMDRLAKVAEKKGWGRRLVEELSEHKGSIVSWLVEIGFHIAEHATPH